MTPLRSKMIAGRAGIVMAARFGERSFLLDKTEAPGFGCPGAGVIHSNAGEGADLGAPDLFPTVFDPEGLATRQVVIIESPVDLEQSAHASRSIGKPCCILDCSD